MVSLTATNYLDCFPVCKDIVETNMKSRKWCGKRQGSERKIVEEKTRTLVKFQVRHSMRIVPLKREGVIIFLIPIPCCQKFLIQELSNQNESGTLSQQTHLMIGSVKNRSFREYQKVWESFLGSVQETEVFSCLARSASCLILISFHTGFGTK